MPAPVRLVQLELGRVLSSTGQNRTCNALERVHAFQRSQIEGFLLFGFVCSACCYSARPPPPYSHSHRSDDACTSKTSSTGVGVRCFRLRAKATRATQGKGAHSSAESDREMPSVFCLLPFACCGFPCHFSAHTHRVSPCHSSTQTHSVFHAFAPCHHVSTFPTSFFPLVLEPAHCARA